MAIAFYAIQMPSRNPPAVLSVLNLCSLIEQDIPKALANGGRDISRKDHPIRRRDSNEPPGNLRLRQNLIHILACMGSQIAALRAESVRPDPQNRDGARRGHQAERDGGKSHGEQAGYWNDQPHRIMQTRPKLSHADRRVNSPLSASRPQPCKINGTIWLLIN